MNLTDFEKKWDESQQCPVRKLHIFSACSLVAGSPGSVILADWR
jgi:hypothetical protein